MTKSMGLVVAGVLALLLAACGKSDETPPVSAPVEAPVEAPATAQMTLPAATADAGKAVYLSLCANCHDGQVPKAPHISMLQIMSPESIYRAMTVGVMQDEAASLDDTQKRDVSQYLAARAFGTAAAQAGPSCTGKAAAFDRAATPALTNWGLQRTNTRLLPAGLSREDLHGLKLLWAFAYPDALRARSQPALAAGAVFVGSHDGTVFALDQATGCVRWTYSASAEVRTGIAISPWTAGDADARPALYFGDLLGNVYGVEAFTGRELWRVRADDHPNATITGTPSLHDGRLYVPVSSLEVTPALDPRFECCKFRGSVVAYDAASGAKLWQTYTIETPPAVTGKNRSGTDMYGPSGAPIWNSPAIDEKRGQLYVGTGENYSSPATLTSDAIFAIDLESGKVNWHYQATPNDAWNTSCDSATPDNCPKEGGPDFDFGAATVLASLSDGRDLVLGGQKSGLVTALDPDTGKLVWNTKVGRGGIQGGIHFGMAAEGDVLYVPISDGEDGRTYPEERRPGLYALDMKTGQYAWKWPAVDVCKGREFCEPGISAAITAMPGMVLAGGMDGVLRIHDGATGKVLWENDTTAGVTATSGATAHGGSIGGAAGPVVANGRLFVNSGYGIYGHMPGNVLLVFGIGKQ
ncbi:PQQ-binding-like beta-propeller repeat protein [Emcibacter sp. SYSU 3D8]|uniref:outer membrane protein assembly factor BamB family protein n=1 Tax=Emcibacter sp. SYSU 3D8 TaxID=3133969 RepID=UPI0031FEFC51